VKLATWGWHAIRKTTHASTGISTGFPTSALSGACCRRRGRVADVTPDPL